MALSICSSIDKISFIFFLINEVKGMLDSAELWLFVSVASMLKRNLGFRCLMNDDDGKPYRYGDSLFFFFTRDSVSAVTHGEDVTLHFIHFKIIRTLRKWDEIINVTLDVPECACSSDVEVLWQKQRSGKGLRLLQAQ